jgi:hypothetical protein
MKAFFYCAAAALACAALAPIANAALVITEVMSSSNNPTENDWWELTNTGPASVQLDGYYWDDDGPAGNDGALFPAYMLGAGESLVIVEADAANFVAAWGGGFNALDQDDFTGNDTFSGLSSNGDQIELWDADPNAGPANLLASVVFPKATQGFSFEWFTNGGSGGLSVAGEFGAFVAPGDEVGGAGTDVGSPGVSAVPSPGSLSCLFGLAILAIRRRGCSSRILAN